MNSAPTSLVLTPTDDRPLLLRAEVIAGALAIASLFVLGKAVGLVKDASGLQGNCWQLTGLRAGLNSVVIVMLLSVLPRARAAVIAGAGIGAILGLQHASVRFFVAGIFAGVATAVVAGLTRSPVRRLIVAAVAFNVALTLAAVLRYAIASDFTAATWLDWSLGSAVRAVASLLVAWPLASLLAKRA